MKTTTTMVIAMIAMMGMTGFVAAMDTNVVYDGDGSYVCNYEATGTGYIGIHTCTSGGTDHLMSEWANTRASGWQEMNTYSGNDFNTNYSGTVITRSATVGGVAIGEDEAGYVWTVTTDDNGNSVISYANYHDNKGQGSHVTTDQTVVVGSLVNIGGGTYNVTGVGAETEISGFAYGSNTTVSGLVRTQSGDEYTYTLLAMENGKMKLFTLSAAGNVNPAVTIPSQWRVGPLAGITLDGACGQWVEVEAKGIGEFCAGAGTDMHGAAFWMVDDLGMIDYYSNGAGVNMSMLTTFDGTFTASGYIYAIDLS